MSPYKKREVPPAEFTRTSFGSQERTMSLLNVLGRCTAGQFAAASVGLAGFIAVVVTQLS
jgi:hypothetical protein